MRGFGLAVGFSALLSLALFIGDAMAAGMPPQVVPSKYAAVVIDTTSGRTLYEANADSRRYPASLTKMMTLYVMFEELDSGHFRLSTPLKVSRLAQSQSPTKLGLRAGDTITVEDAIKGLITRSANDAAVVIAENVSGSVRAFAERMTRTARAIGMKRSHFHNPNGLPDPSNYTTARDMMTLGLALQVRFPRYYPYFSTRSYVYRGRTIGNHNNLLGRIDGVDGIKTGYVQASGFNIVTSVRRDGRKLLVVVMGGRTAAQRDSLVAQMIGGYLPKAERGRGYDGQLVAVLRSAPRLAGAFSRPTREPDDEDDQTPRLAQAKVAPVPRKPDASRERVAAAAPAIRVDAEDAAPHPLPLPAPDRAMAPRLVATVLPPPSTDAPAAAPVAVPMLPPSLADAKLPSSAAEAFSDIAPPARPKEIARAVVPTSPPPRTSADDAVEDDEVTASLSDARPLPGGWVVQIGSLDTERDALSLLEKARSAVGSPLTSAHPVTQVFRKGSQTYIRARFAGFNDRKAADRACSALKKNEFDCISIKL